MARICKNFGRQMTTAQTLLNVCLPACLPVFLSAPLCRLLVLDVRFFNVPLRLASCIERTLAIEFMQDVSAIGQLLPIGCFGVTLLTGRTEQDDELARPDDDGTFSAIASQAMGTRCKRLCLAFCIPLTPLVVLHLPLHAYDAEQAFAETSEVVCGQDRWRALRAQVCTACTMTGKSTPSYPGSKPSDALGGGLWPRRHTA